MDYLLTYSQEDFNNAKSRDKVVCLCICGNRKAVRKDGINITTFSCGCYRKKQTIKANTKHGQSTTTSRSRTYSSWLSMKDRCNNPQNKQYKDYGGRGITYSPRWENFKNFFQDMGERPKGTTLDRINNNQGYCKNNCKWATWFEQAQNKRERQYGTSKTKGVWFEKSRNKWCATLVVNNIKIMRKFFNNEDDAIKALQQQKENLCR